MIDISIKIRDDDFEVEYKPIRDSVEYKMNNRNTKNLEDFKKLVEAMWVASQAANRMKQIVGAAGAGFVWKKSE